MISTPDSHFKAGTGGAREGKTCPDISIYFKRCYVILIQPGLKNTVFSKGRIYNTIIKNGLRFPTFLHCQRFLTLSNRWQSKIMFYAYNFKQVLHSTYRKKILCHLGYYNS